MIIVMIGPPGAGKGTQGRLIAQRYALPLLSMGDMLRDEVRGATAIGRHVEATLQRGGLVENAIIADMLAARLRRPDCAGGFILDGAVRTSAQAQHLDKVLDGGKRAIDSVLYFSISPEHLKARIEKRYSESMHKRDDDNPATLARRLELFEECTRPLRSMYEKRGLLLCIDALGTIEEVSAKIFTHLDALHGDDGDDGDRGGMMGHVGEP